MRRTEDVLDRLRELAANPDAAALRPFASHKSCHVVARAAKIAECAELAAVTPDLAQSFHRFLADPVKTDPGCTAKNAIAIALIALNSLDASVYLAGVRHVQMEGTFGPPEDRAAPLRGICAIGLAQINHPTAAAEIVDLLFDREAPARAGAIRALAHCPMPERESVLRMKALAGDKESAVTGEVFTGLMSQWPAKSADFIARFLNHGDTEVVEEAALAIANWRDERAWQILRPHLDRPEPPRGLLTAAALTRDAAAVDRLLALIRTAPPATAAEAVRALSVHRTDEIEARVKSAAGARGESAVARALRESFG